MRIVSERSGFYVLRFERGEFYPEVFIQFLERRKIRGGFFAGLGACVDPEISFYDLKRKKYIARRFRGDFEVLNITGNVAESGGNIVIHQHITLGRRNFSALGGHLQKMFIGGTLEIFLTPTARMKRTLDKNTGLNLLAP